MGRLLVAAMTAALMSSGGGGTEASPLPAATVRPFVNLAVFASAEPALPSARQLAAGSPLRLSLTLLVSEQDGREYEVGRVRITSSPQESGLMKIETPLERRMLPASGSLSIRSTVFFDATLRGTRQDVAFDVDMIDEAGQPVTVGARVNVSL